MRLHLVCALILTALTAGCDFYGCDGLYPEGLYLLSSQELEIAECRAAGCETVYTGICSEFGSDDPFSNNYDPFRGYEGSEGGGTIVAASFGLSDLARVINPVKTAIDLANLGSDNLANCLQNAVNQAIPGQCGGANVCNRNAIPFCPNWCAVNWSQYGCTGSDSVEDRIQILKRYLNGEPVATTAPPGSEIDLSQIDWEQLNLDLRAIELSEGGYSQLP